MPPRVVGSDLFVCLGSWAGYGHVVYAPNDSSKPTADIRPDRCFASLQDAEAAGFHLPPPPPGGELIETIYLVPPDPPILPVCEEAARRLGITVLCPTLVPGTADSLVDCDQSCVFFKSLVLHFTFSGPPGYVGIPGQNGNHLFVLESRAGNESEVEFLTCSDGRTASGATVTGTAARWVTCPANGSGMNSGHVMLVWTLEGIRYAVSLHADTDLNRKIAMAVAERLVPVTG
jgi:hypothetical protein